MTINEKVTDVISKANELTALVDSIKMACYFNVDDLPTLSALTVINAAANDLKLACESPVTQ